jgi:hypothetical protein
MQRHFRHFEPVQIGWDVFLAVLSGILTILLARGGMCPSSAPAITIVLWLVGHREEEAPAGGTLMQSIQITALKEGA